MKEMGIPDHLTCLFSVVNVPIYIPTNSAEVPLFSTSLPILVISYLFDSHSDRYEVISCGFGCISVLTTDAVKLFHESLNDIFKILFSSFP